jgi:archaellum component FlaC
MVLFNGLLCAASEEQGCVGVRDSREKSGRWWRSPAIKLRGVDHVKEPNLNADQVLGVLLYALQKNDSEAFHRWLDWVKSIGPCTADECLLSGANWPRFCSLQGKESLICAAKPVTCPLIQVVGDLLGEATAAHAVCGDPHVLGTGTGLLSVGLLLKGLPPLPPMPDPVALGYRFKELLSESDGITKRYEDLRQKVEDLRKKLGWAAIPINPLPKTDTLKKQIEIEIEKLELAVREIRDLARIRGLGGLTLAYHRAELIAAANAEANEPGFPRHHAAVALFLLQKLGIPSPGVKKGVERLVEKQKDENMPANPFFEFLANGRSPELLQLILDQCPATEYNDAIPRFQWSWERHDSKKEAGQTMYWDCLFIAQLWKNGSPKPETPVPGSLPQSLVSLHDARRIADEAKTKIENDFKNASLVIAEIKNAADHLEAQLEDLKKAFEAFINDLPPRVNEKGEIEIPLAPGTPGSPTFTLGKKGPSISVGGKCRIGC